MNFRTTIILTILVLGALVFVFVANSGSDAEKEKKADTTVDAKGGGRKLFDVKTEEVQKIVVTPDGGGGKTVELAKADGKWKLVQPTDWPATDWEVRSLVDAVTGLKSQGTVELKESNRSATGLDKPRFRIELTDAKGTVSRLAIGDRAAIGSGVFVRVGDESTGELASGAALSAKLDKGTDGLIASVREKQLVRTTSSEVRQVEVAQRDRKLVLQKDGTNWKLVAPQEVPADADEVANLISAVTNLRAEEFSDAAAAEAGGAQLDRPRVSVTLNTAAPATQPAATPPAKPVTVAFGQPTDVDETKVWVRVSNPSVVAKGSMSTQALERLTKASPLSLRDRKAIDLDPEQVAEVSLAVDRPSTTQPTTKPAEQKQFHIVRRKESLALGPAIPPGSPAAPTTGPATEPATGPSTAPSTAPSTTPSTEPATAPATKPAADVKPPSKWVLASEGNADADDGQVADLLSALHPLRAEKYVEPPSTTQPSTEPATKPAPATFTLTIKSVAPGGTETAYDLVITDPADAAAKPTVRYKDLTFEVDRALLKKLDGDFKTKKPEEPAPAGMPSMPGFPGGPGGFPG